MTPQYRFQDIISERIDDTFSYGIYGDFKVILMNKNGYVNATKMCALGDKRFDNWLPNKASKDLIEALKQELLRSPGLSGDPMIFMKCHNDTTGTYVHPKLIPHIAAWCSPTFALRISDIINHFFAREYQSTITKKDEKIDQLQADIKQLLQECKHQSKMLEVTNDTLGDVKGELIGVRGELVDVKEELVEANENVIDLKASADETNHRLETVQEKLIVFLKFKFPADKNLSSFSRYSTLTLSTNTMRFEVRKHTLIQSLENFNLNTSAKRL